jgi:alanine-alpha-ketoisovalerate/valine-pyruvate aminotransferase
VDSIDYIISRNDVLFIGERVITDLYTDKLQAIVEMIENLIENDEIQECIDAWNN